MVTKQIISATAVILLLSIFPARSQVESQPKQEKPRVLTFPRGTPPPPELILSPECDRHKFTTPVFSKNMNLGVVMTHWKEYNTKSTNMNLGGLRPNAGKTGYFEIGIDKAEDNWLKVVISFPEHSLGGITPPMAMSEDGKRFALTYKLTDLIEIYDSDANLVKRIQGPEGFFPSVKQKAAGEGVRVAQTKGETRDAYFSPMAYNNEIWIMYSGKPFDPQESYRYLKNTILVFDWDGNPLRRYSLDIPVFAISIDKKQRKLYGITDYPDFQVISFDLNKKS